MTAAAIMFQGTGSDVGKSLIVAGLARAYSRRGLAVRPFKPQNMSNNAAVTADGGEIGRAQALQARACGVEPSVHMNPVLLKPQSEIGAQVVLQGRVWGTAKARDYQTLKATFLPAVLDSFARQRGGADLVLVEGAGSPAEVNLRDRDIANMGFAAAAKVPVLLVGDVDRGGVIASIVGTYALLDAPDRAWLKGYVINKFRGDVRLFDDGIAAIGARTALPSLGIVPFFAAAGRLPAEDAMALSGYAKNDAGALKIAVPMLARIANFDDLDPLRAEPDVSIEMVPPGQPLPGDADLVVLPGSKSTIADLAMIRAEGWDIDMRAHLRRGGWVLGLCGGYQMLGRRLADPDGVEGPAGAVDGLGLLALETELAGDKTLVAVSGRDIATGESVIGYEMHIGRTHGPALARPMLRLGEDRSEGAQSKDGRVLGCYVHGLFAADGFRHAFLNRIRARAVSGVAYEQEIETILDALADHLAAHLDLDRILEIARAG
ncbi:cobyric acid synthase [Rhodospirillaceae bacterium SYSU D60014]|uniref:cobyric acid synthase n=1 Tax=Virgifigura deserti TaxID=2268457 RepID=UPI000E66AFE3